MTILHLDVPPVKPWSEVSRPRGSWGATCGTLAGAASAVARDTQAAKQPVANTSGNPRECWQPD